MGLWIWGMGMGVGGWGGAGERVGETTRKDEKEAESIRKRGD